MSVSLCFLKALPELALIPPELSKDSWPQLLLPAEPAREGCTGAPPLQALPANSSGSQ